MVSLQKGLLSNGIVMVIFGSVYVFILLTGLLITIATSDADSAILGILWAIGGIMFVFSMPVYIMGLCKIGAASRDVGMKASRVTLFGIPLGVMGVISLFLNIPFLIEFVKNMDNRGLCIGMSLTMPLGWMLMAASSYCTVAHLRGKTHLVRAKTILTFELITGIALCVLLSLISTSLMDRFEALAPVYILLYVGPPLPVIIISAIQFFSCSKAYKLPETAPPVRVFSPTPKREPYMREPPLLPFVQYDFSGTLTPEMFAKGFCFNCQAFVSSSLEICPKCMSEIEKEEIVRII